MSEEEKILRDLLASWEDAIGSGFTLYTPAATLFKRKILQAQLHLLSKDTAKARSAKIIEIHKELAEERRKTQLRQGAALGWAVASKKLERLGIPTPTENRGDWDCRPASAPHIRGEITEGEHAPTYIAASWTGEWEVWGWKEGEYWSHHGKISRKAIEERVETIMTELYKEAAKKRGIEL